MYYACKRSDHFKTDCPTLKKSFKRSKKKAMVTTWSDSDESGLDEDTQNEVNLCFMAQEDEVNSEPSLKFTFEEL